LVSPNPDPFNTKPVIFVRFIIYVYYKNLFEKGSDPFIMNLRRFMLP